MTLRNGIAFGAEIMSGRRVYVSPVYDGTGRSVVMEDQYGPVTIWLLPFLKPAAGPPCVSGPGDRDV